MTALGQRWLVVTLTSAALLVVVHSTAGGSPSRVTRGQRRAVPPALLMRYPQSVSFVSASTGWAWGPLAWPLAGRRQPGVLAHTGDGGRTWSIVSTPPVAWIGPRGGADRVHFVDSRRGYLFGSQLWYTADGGRRWRRLAPGGAVLDIAGRSRAVFALVMACRPQTPCATAHLERLDGTRSTRAFPAPVSAYSNLAVRGPTLFLLDPATSPQSTLWLSRDRGRHWASHPAPCVLAAALAAWSDTGLALACGSEPGAGNQAKSFYASSDGGRTWSLRSRRGLINDGGYLGSLAALDGRTWVLSLVRFPGVEISHDGGRTWASPPSTAFSGEWWGPLSLAGSGEIVAAPGTLNGHELAFGGDDARRWHAVEVAGGRLGRSRAN